MVAHWAYGQGSSSGLLYALTRTKKKLPGSTVVKKEIPKTRETEKSLAEGRKCAEEDRHCFFFFTNQKRSNRERRSYTGRHGRGNGSAELEANAPRVVFPLMNTASTKWSLKWSHESS